MMIILGLFESIQRRQRKDGRKKSAKVIKILLGMEGEVGTLQRGRVQTSAKQMSENTIREIMTDIPTSNICNK